MIFSSHQLVERIERAQASSLRAIVETCASEPEVWPCAGGLALFAGVGSTLNKVVGLGFEPLDEAALAELEQRYLSRGAAVQIELTTHAEPAVSSLLARRGYQLTGCWNLLGRALDDLPEVSADTDVRLAAEHELETWIDVLASGFSPLAGDEVAAAHDLGRQALERVFRDMARVPSLGRWLAFRDGDVAGGAGMSVEDGITQLFGAATLPQHRRRGVQSALLNARLRAGRARGSELAVVTTEPGSHSQKNAQRAGFSLLYARALWLLPAPH